MIEYFEQLGDGNVLLLTGLVTGLIFGIFAQQSSFCLRSATIEFWNGKAGEKLAIWLLVFGTAFFLTQLQVFSGSLDTSVIRQLNGSGSLSGAVIGGTVFGIGMILSRGCASRLLVLSGTGNLRALTAGLVLTVAAQASLTGALSPLREWLSSLWLISGNERNLGTWLPLWGGLALSGTFVLVAVADAFKTGIRPWIFLASVMTGLAVALGWYLTNWHHSWSFEVIPVQSVSFTGPSADTLMGLINSPNIEKTFGTGLVPGVFAGSFLAAFVTGQFRIQSFTADTGTFRYMAGAVMMGFGGMLAGGCAVGAGVTGGAVLATTAWVALLSMWISAGLGDLLFNRTGNKAASGRTA